jgi:hypothetical protein
VYFQRSHDWTAANVQAYVDADVRAAVSAYRGRRTISRAAVPVGPVPAHPHSRREIRVTEIIRTCDATTPAALQTLITRRVARGTRRYASAGIQIHVRFL